MKSSVPAFRIVALLEGISFLVLLFVAMPLKYIYQMPLPVRITGMAHGVLFIAYIFYLVQVRSERNWTGRQTALALLASVLPFGTFVMEAKMLR